jgi:alkanesulfonate monooxygenase SsuD/methylene tetrahydromethanopterin reductase-like flavin-dependent oxidoreductase (luciferase family)
MVLNLLTPVSAGRLVTAMRRHAEAAGRNVPRVALWASAAADPDEDALAQLRRALVSYLGAPGYSEMFEEAGYGEVVALARSGSHPGEVLAAIPRSLVEAVGLVGTPAQIRARLAEYAEAGVDEVSLVASCTDADPAGAHTLSVLSQMGAPARPGPQE